MSPENYKILKDKYPDLLRTSEISVGDGWFDIVDRLFNNIAQYSEKHKMNTKVIILNEKFGTMRCLLAGGDKYCYDLIRHADAECEHTCEECGSPGTLNDNDGWWWKVSCEPCQMVARLTS